MLQSWPAILFGWPAIVLAGILSVVGIARKRPLWPVLAAILVAPVSFYLTGSPRFGWIGVMIPLSLLAASASVHYRRATIAWILLAPVAGVFAWLAIVVVND